MIDKVIELYRKHREVVFYLIFGVLTTVVNYVVYVLCRLLLPPGNYRMAIANLIAWILSVVFAYLTNRAYVFRSKTAGEAALKEFWSFVAARIFSLVLDMGILYGAVTLLHWNDYVVKILSNVVVVVVNYVLSKLFIFRPKAE